MSATSGPTSGKQFAVYDHDSHCWRTWPDTGLWGSIEFSGTVPKTGYLSDGCLYELPMSAHPTGGSGCSSLLPTPRTSDTNGAGLHGSGGHARNLGGEVKSLLPTPAACNPNDGEGTETWLARRARVKERAGNGNGMGTPLSIAVQLLPTPTQTNAQGNGRNNRGEPLLPGVALLIGASTPQPSDDGNTSRDDPPQPQQSQGATDLDCHLF